MPSGDHMKTPAVFRSLQGAVRELKISMGMDIRMKKPDRKVLENVIFAEILKDESLQRIMFVGTAWYTLYYNKLFKDKEFWTVEPDAAEARYGSPGRHIVDKIENIDRHFSDGYLDAVICNGVFGFGLNERDDVATAVRAMRKILRQDGVLLIGYNTIPSRCPFPIAECAELSRFVPYQFGPLRASEYVVPGSLNEHTFLFFRK
jgi:hypothetical protein